MATKSAKKIVKFALSLDNSKILLYNYIIKYKDYYMEKLVFINACVRKENSRTLALAKEALALLSKKYEVSEIDLTSEQVTPVTKEVFDERSKGISERDRKWAESVASADRLVIAAPFWDMSFPAVLKVFFERISVCGITFADTESGNTVGLCRAKKVLYITTRGMEIADGDVREQATPYIKALCWLWGMGEVITLSAIGMDVKEGGAKERLSYAVEKGKRICEEF